MALIADLCPNCQQVTRCQVVERNSVIGGVVLGIPFFLPSSSVTLGCGQCGCEFKSQTWDHQRVLSPEEAVSLDIDAILSLTNPTLQQQLTLPRLKAVPELATAFQLMEQLRPGILRIALKDAVLKWPALDEGEREQFLADANRCAEALQFAHLMANRYKFGLVGCLAGVVVCVAVWSGCVVVYGADLSPREWLGVIGAGVMAGALLSSLLWSGRDRRWLHSTLIPEADRAGIRLEWLLVILEGTGTTRDTEDELASLRQLAPALRAELTTSGKTIVEPASAFG